MNMLRRDADARLMLLIALAIVVTAPVSGLSMRLRMSAERGSGSSMPVLESTDFKRSLTMAAAAIPIALAVTNPRISLAAPAVKLDLPPPGLTLPLGKEGYVDLGGLSMCRLLNGMWQVDGSHGYEPMKEKAVSEMSHCAGKLHEFAMHSSCVPPPPTLPWVQPAIFRLTTPSTNIIFPHLADEGFTTFDLADHYGPAEDYVGFFSKGRLSSALSKECQVRDGRKEKKS